LSNLLASVLLLTYNQERFVAQSLHSLLDQDIANLEIIVSDDKSSDNTWSIIKKIALEYTGNKTIVLNRNTNNLGVVNNFFKAFELSQGEVLFTAAGDDISLPTRCSASISLWVNAEKKPDLVATDAFDMSIDGDILGIKQTDNLHNWDLKKWTLCRPFIFGASQMTTRRLLNLGGLDPLLPYEDQCLLFRALLMGGAIRLPQPLVMHRRGGISQQAKDYSYTTKQKKLLQSSIDSLAECKQMIFDATVMNAPIFVLKKLEANKFVSLYLQHMMLANNFTKKLLLFINSVEIPFPKRFRYFQFAVFSGVHSALMKFKKKLNRTSP
jgi:glycosyltransferase involved in cell wall biosynthesis